MKEAFNEVEILVIYDLSVSLKLFHWNKYQDVILERLKIYAWENFSNTNKDYLYKCYYNCIGYWSRFHQIYFIGSVVMMEYGDQ